MDNLLKLKQTLSQRGKEQIPVMLVWAVVKAVDWDKKTMTAEGVMDGLDFNDVLLGLGSKYVKPVIGSKCLIGLIENNAAAAFLVDCGDVDDIEWKVSGKYLVKNTTENLLTLMTDTLDAILAVRHMTNSGPTINLTPDSRLRFEQLKTRFNNLLKST